MTLFEFQLIYLYCRGGRRLVGKIEIPAATSLLQKVEKRDFFNGGQLTKLWGIKFCSPLYSEGEVREDESAILVLSHHKQQTAFL